MENTINNYYSNNSDIHNFFFHPLYSEHVGTNLLSIITNIGLTILSGGLWLIPFIYFNLTDKKVEVLTTPVDDKINQVAGNSISNQSQPKPDEEPAIANTTQNRPPETKEPETKEKENPNIAQNMPKLRTKIIGILPSSLAKKIQKNGDEPSQYLELQDLGRKFTSIAGSKFSKDLIDEFPLLESFFLKKLKDETNPHILELKKLLESLNFKEKPQFADMTTFDFLMIAMLVGAGQFSCDRESFECPELQIITLKALNPIMVELYQDTKLPLSLRRVIKDDYIHRVGGCLLDHRGNYIIDKFGEDKWQEFFKIRDAINENPDKICALEILQPLFDQADKSNINYLIDMNPPRSHNGTKAFEWVLGSLGYDMKFSTRLLQDCALQVDPEQKIDITQALKNESITHLASLLNVKITVYHIDNSFNLLRYVRGPKDANVELKIAYQEANRQPSTYFGSGYILT